MNEFFFYWKWKNKKKNDGIITSFYPRYVGENRIRTLAQYNDEKLKFLKRGDATQKNGIE